MVKNRATQPNSSIVCFMSVAVHVIEGRNDKGSGSGWVSVYLNPTHRLVSVT